MPTGNRLWMNLIGGTMTDKQIITKENVKDVLLKAKEKLWYMAIDCSTGNPVDLRERLEQQNDR